MDRSLKKEIKIYFYIVIMTAVLEFILDYFEEYIVSLPGTVQLHMLIIYIKYMISSALLAGILLISERDSGQKKKCLLMIPLLAEIIVLVISYPFGLVASVDPVGNHFIEGPLIFITWATLLVYMGLIFLSAIRAHSTQKECFFILFGEGAICINILCERVLGSVQGMEHMVIILAILIYYLYFSFHAEAEILVEKEKALSQAQTQAMISQIKPHFIYNSLACIAEICHEQLPEGEDAILTFSSYLRNCYQTLSEDGLIPFEKELTTIKHYLDLEKMQSPESIHVEYYIEEQEFMVPILAIETLVENAVKHGIRKKHGLGTIVIRTFRDERGIVVIIKDDGLGFDPSMQMPDENHLGIKNARMRLREQCGAAINIMSKPGSGTEIEILFLQRSL